MQKWKEICDVEYLITTATSSYYIPLQSIQMPGHIGGSQETTKNDTPMLYIALYFCHTMIASGESSYCFLSRRISSRTKTNSLDLVGRVGRDFYYFCKMEGECRFLLLEWHPLYRYSNAKTVAVWQ